MATSLPRPLLRLRYAEAAQAYLKSLPLEHFMEAPPQATQRKIAVESLDLVQVVRPEVQTFNELLVQYPRRGSEKLGQVVPDNMVVVWPEPIQFDNGSYDLVFQPARPFWMLEYVSKNNKRKDYEDNFQKYEQELRVPYYLIFYPDAQDMTLFRLTTRKKYRAVAPNKQGRCPLPELELELGLLDGWVRFWFRGQLLPLPGDLQRQLLDTQQALAAEQQRARAAKAEIARLHAELEQLQARGQEKP